MSKLVREFINSQYVGSLAWVGEDGSPRVATVYYVFDGARGLIFKSRAGSEHMQCLIRDSRAAMGVYNHDSTYASKEGVQLKGMVSRLTSSAEMAKFVGQYANKFPGAGEKFVTLDELVSEDASSTLYRFRVSEAKYTSTEHKVAETEYQIMT